MIAALLLGMAASCTSSEGQEPVVAEPEEVGFSIFASSMSMQTRADYPEGKTYDNELINTYYVAFVKDGTVVAVEEGGSSSDAAWSKPLKTILPAASGYSAYAFANMDKDYIENTLGIKMGAEIDHDDLMAKTYDLTDGTTCFPAGTDIPMAGYLTDFKVAGTVNEKFAIEVVRLYSRVEFAFVKKTDTPITVESIELQPVNSGNIYLMPDYDNKPKPNTQNPLNPPSILENVGYSTAFPSFSAIQVPNDASGDVSERVHFYIKESIAKDGNHPTGHFHIKLGIKRGESDLDYVYALADDNLKFFYRNDYVLFRIALTDRTPDFEIRSYPPIGGYAATIEEKNHEFYATFNYGGDFEVRAFMRQGNDEIEDENIEVTLKSVSDPNNILESQTFTPSSIGGKNGFSNVMQFGVEGTAVLTFEIVDKSVNTPLTYERKVFLIFENPKN